MLGVLQFIFSSFWIWLGTLMMLATVTSIFASVLGALRIGNERVVVKCDHCGNNKEEN